MVDFPVEVFVRDTPFSKIIDLLKSFALADAQLASPPQIFQRRFAIMPLPHLHWSSIRPVQIPRPQGAFFSDRCHQSIAMAQIATALPIGKFGIQFFLVADKLMPPIGIETGGNHRRIVRPILKQKAFFFDQLCQMFGAVGLTAGKQDHMLGPLNPLDRIKLNIAKLRDQVAQFTRAKGFVGWSGQTLQVQDQTPGLLIREYHGHSKSLPEQNANLQAGIGWLNSLGRGRFGFLAGEATW